MVWMAKLINGKKFKNFSKLSIFLVITLFHLNLNAAWLGVQLSMNKENDSLVITATAENSPANEGGIKPGDTILSANGQSFKGKNVVKDFVEYLSNVKNNSKVKLVVLSKND